MTTQGYNFCQTPQPVFTKIFHSQKSHQKMFEVIKLQILNLERPWYVYLPITYLPVDIATVPEQV